MSVSWTEVWGAKDRALNVEAVVLDLSLGQTVGERQYAEMSRRQTLESSKKRAAYAIG